MKRAVCLVGIVLGAIVRRPVVEAQASRTTASLSAGTLAGLNARLVLGTLGRGVYIVDDSAPLRAATAETPASARRFT
jgi:hypothetical protein